MQTVLNTPVAAHGLQQGPRSRRQTGDVVAGFRDDLFALSPLALDQDQAVQVGSDLAGVHVPPVFRRPQRPAAARLNAAAVLVHDLVAVVVATLETLSLLDGEGLGHGPVQLRPVALERQHIVGPRSRIVCAIRFWQPMASMVTMRRWPGRYSSVHA